MNDSAEQMFNSPKLESSMAKNLKRKDVNQSQDMIEHRKLLSSIQDG